MHIVISYRRDDSQDVSGRIYDRLCARFGRGSVFQDVQSNFVGSEFPDVISREIRRADVVLPIIGKDWAAIRDDRGNRRLHSPDDVVRWELEQAYQLRKRIIPVLVNGARMPKSTELPSTLRWLTRIDAAVVRSGKDFDSDIRNLSTCIDPTTSWDNARLVPLHPSSRGKRNDRRDLIDMALDVQTSMHFPANPLRDVLDYLAEVHRLQILCDESALADVGLTMEVEVSLVGSGTSLRAGLEILLSNAGGIPLAYQVTDNGLVVTTREFANTSMETMVYDVADLEARQVRSLELVSLILRNTSGPWMEIDGVGATISVSPGGFLVAYANQSLHAEIEHFLESVRSGYRQRELQRSEFACGAR